MAVNKLAQEAFSFLVILPPAKTYECYNNNVDMSVFFLSFFLFLQLKKIPVLGCISVALELFFLCFSFSRKKVYFFRENLINSQTMLYAFTSLKC